VPHPRPIRTLRSPPHCLADDVICTVGRVLQRPPGEMRVTLRHRWVRMTQYLLDLIKRPSAVHQEGRILMTEVVDPQMRQTRHCPQLPPDLVDGRVPSTGVVAGVKLRLFAAAMKWRNGTVASLRNVLLRFLDAKTGYRHQSQFRTG